MNENRENLDTDSIPDEDIPDLTTPEWEKAILAAPVRPGRPSIDNPKISTTVRLDADVIEALKSGGKGWQTRLNEMLRNGLGL